MIFLNFIKSIYFLFGCDVDQRFSRNSKISLILKLWRFLQPTIMIIGTLQLWIYFCLLSKDTSALEIASIILDILFFTKSFAGFLTVVICHKSSIKLIHKIDRIYTKITKDTQNIEDEEIVKKVYSFSIKIFIMLSFMILSSFLGSLGKIIIAVVTNTHPTNLSIMSLWMPEYLKNSWLFVVIHNTLTVTLFSLGNIFASEVIYITSAYLTASFDKLGDKVKDVIDETEDRPFLETKRMLSECVDIHSELIKLADLSNRLYGPFSLILLLLVSVGFCILGIMILVIIFDFCYYTFLSWNQFLVLPDAPQGQK
ncbi:hypothetical protein ACKWTF_014843 [Chironomus riparius]